MKLTNEQKEQMKPKLELLKPCSCCHKMDWTISDTIYELREFFGGSFTQSTLSGRSFPVVPIICSNCGNTLFLSAVSLGIIKGGTRVDISGDKVE